MNPPPISQTIVNESRQICDLIEFQLHAFLPMYLCSFLPVPLRMLTPSFVCLILLTSHDASAVQVTNIPCTCCHFAAGDIAMVRVAVNT